MAPLSESTKTRFRRGAGAWAQVARSIIIIFLGTQKHESTAFPEVAASRPGGCGEDHIDANHAPHSESAGRHWPNSDVRSKKPAQSGRPNGLAPLATCFAAPQKRRRARRNGAYHLFAWDIKPSFAQRRDITGGIKVPPKGFQRPFAQ